MNIILFDDIPKFISITDPRGRHLKKVLRVQRGDTFRAGLVNGPLGEIRVLTVNGGGSEAEEAGSGSVGTKEGYEVEWRETGPAVEPWPLSLIVGFVRPISAKRILREAASLGVGRLIFTVTDTGERSYREANLWKGREWREYLVNGLQTAGATVLPDLLLTGGVEEAVRWAENNDGSARFVLDNISPEVSLAGLNLKAREVVLAVGSERGWSSRERRIFGEAGFESVGLGGRVLRTETACSVGAALALAGMGLLL